MRGKTRPVCTMFVAAGIAALVALAGFAPAPAYARSSLPAPAWPVARHSGWRAFEVSWDAVDGADGYAVYRWSPASRRYVRRAVTRATSWRDAGLRADRRYTYKVASCTRSGGRWRPGRRGRWVSAVTYSRGARTVNPGTPVLLRANRHLCIGKAFHAKVKVPIGRYASRVAAKGAAPFSDKLRFVSSDRSVLWSSGSYQPIAVGTGTCRVWAVAANGMRSRPVRVRVSHNPSPGRFVDPGLYDPEIIEFMNDRADVVHDLTERLYARWDRHPKRSVSRDDDMEAFPLWMSAKDRSSLRELLASWGEDGVYLRSVSFTTSGDGVSGKAHFIFEFYSAIAESETPWDFGYRLIGSVATGGSGVANGWKLGYKAGIDC